MIRSYYGHGFAKQYVRDHRALRTLSATNNVYDYGVNKDVENLPRLRDRMSAIIDNYHNVQQDVLETFIHRGQLRKLAEPSILRNGRRIPGLKLDHSRQLAVMHALVRFANVAAGGQFTTADLYAQTLAALGRTAAQYSLASFRYDLSKLRAKGLVERIPHSRRYCLVGAGYSICVVLISWGRWAASCRLRYVCLSPSLSLRYRRHEKRAKPVAKWSRERGAGAQPPPSQSKKLVNWPGAASV